MENVKCSEKNSFLHFEELEQQGVRPRCVSDMTHVRGAEGFVENERRAWEEFAPADALSTVQEDEGPRTPDYSPSPTPHAWKDMPLVEGFAQVRIEPVCSCPGTPEYTHPHNPERTSTPEQAVVQMPAQRPAGQQIWTQQHDIPAGPAGPAGYRRLPAHAEIKDALPNDVTLMLRNIPNKYSQELLLEHIREYMPYIDFFYIPIDFKKNCNLGYAFVNFTNGRAADEFVARYDGNRLPSYRKSPKVLAVQRARVQGLDANVQKFRSSAVMGSNSDAFKPLLFRDGEQVEFPKPENALPPIGNRYTRTNRAR